MADQRVKRLVNIDVNASGIGTVEVEGADVSATTQRLEVNIDPNGRGTELTLHMRHDRLRFAGSAAVGVDRDAAWILQVLGWTPPGEEVVTTLEVTETVEVTEDEFVLTWHPLEASDDGMVLTDGEPVEVPLNEHWVLPGDRIGEFRLSTREVPSSASDCDRCIADNDDGSDEYARAVATTSGCLCSPSSTPPEVSRG